jgi:RNA polymerase sigma-70 factor, ECF subfamily
LQPPVARLARAAPDSFGPWGVLITGGRVHPSPPGVESEPPEDLLQDVAVLVGLTDEELVARSVGGDTDSFNQLIKRWERPIYALAYRTLGREEDARDVCQETFLRAFRALGGFKGQAKFSSWLYRIALNLCRDWQRRERRAPVVAAPDGVDLVELAGEGEGVERVDDAVARKDLSRAVAKAMRSLPEDQRTAIVLKEYHGLTFQEIAELLGCPLSTVKTRLYQGLTVLRRELERDGIGSANGSASGSGRPARTMRAI